MLVVHPEKISFRRKLNFQQNSAFTPVFKLTHKDILFSYVTEKVIRAFEHIKFEKSFSTFSQHCCKDYNNRIG